MKAGKILLCFALCFVMIFGSACAGNRNDVPGTDTDSDTHESSSAGGESSDTGNLPDEPDPVTYTYDELVSALSPIAAWNCEPSEDGKTVADSVGGITGKMVNCDSVDGRTGKAIQTYADEKSYIELGTGTLGKLMNGKGAVTFSMWIMPYVNYADTYRLLTVQINNKTAGFHVYYKEGGILVGGRSNLKDSFVARDFSYNLDDKTLASFGDYTNEGRWQHIVMTLDFAGDNVLLYVNGTKIYSLTNVNFDGTQFALGNPADTDAFGGAATDKVLSFNGITDEIMMFDRVLTAEEILMLYREEGTDNSPAADEYLIRDIVDKMGDGFAVFKDSTNVLHNGMIEKIYPSDYSVSVKVSNGEFLIPKAAAETYFAVTDSVACENIGTIPYCKLSELCKANGRTLLVYGDMAVVAGDGSPFDKDRDAVMLERMKKFFTDGPLLSELDCEQSRTVVAKTGDLGTVKYCQSPSIAVKDGVIWETMDSYGQTYVYRSTDGGKSFENTAVISNFNYATVFVNNGALYLIGRVTYNNMVTVGICRSTDGVNWSQMNSSQGVLPGGEYNVHGAATPVLFANGRIYKAFGRMGKTWKEKCQAFMVSADASADLLDPASWTVSDSFTFESSMFTNHANGSKIPSFVYIEEGNAVAGKDGSIYAMYRVNSQPDPGYVVILKLSADNKTLSVESGNINSVIKFDGGVTKFTVRYDEATDLYISLVNNITVKEGIWQRNVLSIAVSKDMYNWEIADTVLTDRTMMNEYVSITRHGFQYVDWVIDNGDILLAVREAMDDSELFHNANYLTFYRLKDYRSVISDLIEEK